MNGYSILFTAVLIVVLAGTAGAISWGMIRGMSALASSAPSSHSPQLIPAPARPPD